MQRSACCAMQISTPQTQCIHFGGIAINLFTRNRQAAVFRETNKLKKIWPENMPYFEIGCASLKLADDWSEGMCGCSGLSCDMVHSSVFGCSMHWTIRSIESNLFRNDGHKLTIYITRSLDAQRATKATSNQSAISLFINAHLSASHCFVDMRLINMRSMVSNRTHTFNKKSLGRLACT